MLTKFKCVSFLVIKILLSESAFLYITLCNQLFMNIPFMQGQTIQKMYSAGQTINNGLNRRIPSRIAILGTTMINFDHP